MKYAPKNNNATGQGGGVGKAKASKCKCNSRSTSTEAQIERLVEMLRIRPHHTHELRKLGISHPAGRIQNLEEMGFVIGSDRINTVDSDGFLHTSPPAIACLAISFTWSSVFAASRTVFAISRLFITPPLHIQNEY